MRLASRIESFPTAPGNRDVTFKASVVNGFFYGGEFEFRLRVISGVAGETVRFTSEIQKRKLAPGASASLLFPSDLPDSRTPPAVIELRAPGAEGWCLVETEPVSISR